MKRKDFSRIWTTKKEISFIQGLSKDLLEKYYRALLHRKNWGQIDKSKIEDECKRILNGR